MDEKIIEVRAVLKYLIKKGLSNEEILNELHNEYGPDCISLRTVQDRRKRLHDGTFSIFDLPRSGRPPITNLDTTISDLILEDPSLSAKALAEQLNISKTTVKTIIEERLGMHKVNFKWVPHKLTPEIRAQRVEKARTLLEFLCRANSTTLNSIYTEDETWIYYDNPRTSMWVLNGKDRPTIAKRTIQSKKLMIAVFCTRNGIKAVVSLPEGEKFTKEFFKNEVVGFLEENDDRQKKIFHFDNARPHMIDDYLKEKKIKRLPQPPYSPDIAPSDFFLVGYLKMKLEGHVFEEEDELLEKVHEILFNIPNDMFKRAFEEWIERLDEVIKRDGDYI